MVVYREVFSDPPTDLIRRCLESHEAFAKRVGAELLTITEYPGWLEDYKSYIPKSDYVRVKYAADNPHCMHVDWDIEILADFELPEDLSKMVVDASYPECIFYNGDDTAFFQDRLDEWIEYQRNTGEGTFPLMQSSRMSKIFRCHRAGLSHWPANMYRHYAGPQHKLKRSTS